MDLHINLWGVLLAAVSSLVIGALYYAPFSLGGMWAKYGNIDMARYKKEQGRIAPVLIIGALVGAYFVAYFGFLFHAFFQDSWLGAYVSTAFFVWIGFAATTVVVHGAVDQRPRQLTYLTLGNRLLSLIGMGLILGWLHP